MNFLTWILTLIIPFAWAKDPILECSFKSDQAQLEFTIYDESNLHLRGKIQNQPVDCSLRLEEVTDLHRARGPEIFRLNSKRMDKDCAANTALSIKKGLEDQVDILVYRKSAKAFLFEEAPPVKCIQFKADEAGLKTLSKIPKKKYRAEYTSRTVKPFDFVPTLK